MEINTEDVVMYYYYDNTKTKRWTPNAIFATARAEHYGTKDVFVKKYPYKA